MLTTEERKGITTSYRDAMLEAYMECGLWLEPCRGTADHDSCDGEECDVSLDHLSYDTSDIEDLSSEVMRDDCEDFLRSVFEKYPGYLDAISPEAMGYDFWLTRNGHGSGFWDRGYGYMGDWLASLAKAYGGTSLYAHCGEVYYQ